MFKKGQKKNKKFKKIKKKGWQENINRGTKIVLDIKEKSQHKRQYILYYFTLE